MNEPFTFLHTACLDLPLESLQKVVWEGESSFGWDGSLGQPWNVNSVRGGVTLTSESWDLPPVPRETLPEAQTPKDLNENPPFPSASLSPILPRGRA